MSKQHVDERTVPLAMGTSNDPTQFGSVTDIDTDDEEGIADDEKVDGGKEKKDEDEEDEDEVAEIKYWDKRWSSHSYGCGSNN
jgi:hypothetical protein